MLNLHKTTYSYQPADWKNGYDFIVVGKNLSGWEYFVKNKNKTSTVRLIPDTFNYLWNLIKFSWEFKHQKL